MDNIEVDCHSGLKEVLDAVKKEYENVPEGVALSEKICDRLQFTYDNPPVDECKSFICNHEYVSLTSDELRMVMFNPTLDDVKYYPVFIENTQDINKHSPKMKGIFLTLLFLVHRHKWWFLSEFVIQNGMSSLASLFVDDNLYYRGQAVDIMMWIIDCDVYDWFHPLQSSVDYKLHSVMYSLLCRGHKSSPLLENLCQNNCKNVAKNTNDPKVSQNMGRTTFPGGSVKCLQILGFWLSWLRRSYTPNQILPLSDMLIHELDEWRKNPFIDNNDSGVSEVVEGEEEMLKEIQFAEIIYKDFAFEQYKGVDEKEKNEFFNTDKVKGVYGVINTDRSLLKEPTKSVVVEGNELTTSSSSSAPESSQVPLITKTLSVSEYKELGNIQYKERNYDESFLHYSCAIDSLLNEKINSSDNDSEIELSPEDCAVLCTLMFNVLTVVWKVYSIITLEASGSNGNTEIDSNNLIYSKYTRVLTFNTLQLLVVDATHVKRVVNCPCESFHSAAALLDRCSALCNDILLMQPYHVKAVYRLASVLLIQNKPSAALNLIDECVSSGVNVDNDALHTLHAKRIQCVAALLVSGKKSVDSTVQNTAAANKPLVNSKVNCILASLKARKEKDAKSKLESTEEKKEADIQEGTEGTVAEENDKQSTAPVVRRAKNAFNTKLLSATTSDDTSVNKDGSVSDISAIDEGYAPTYVTEEINFASESASKMLKKLSKSKSKDKNPTSGTAVDSSKSKKKEKKIIIPGLESLGDLKKKSKTSIHDVMS